MTSLLEPYKKPLPMRLPPYFYLLLAMALLSIPRPVLHLPTKFRTSTTNLQAALRNDTIDGQSVESVTFPKQDPPDEHDYATECGHIVLVSAARHGSTWLIDSVEGCKSVNGSYGTVNRYAELWNTGQFGPLRTILPEDAAKYAMMNHSVKIFPPSLTNSMGEMVVHDFFAAVKRHGTPVFVLRRRLEDSYGSLVVAKENRAWNVDNRITGDAEERKIVKDAKWSAYVIRMAAYFKEVTTVMRETGVQWDEIRYEDVVGKPRIVGERNRCHIRNCNFRRRR